MAKFENMTLSYTQIASVPFKTRRSASGSLLDALSRDLTPGQRVALFPSYVNQIYASGGVKDAKTVPSSGGGGPPPRADATVETVGPPKPSKGLTIIPAGLIPDPVTGKPMRVPDQQEASSNIKTGDRFQDVIKNYKSRMIKDLGITDFQADGVLGNLAQESDRFRAYNEYGGGPGIGWAQWTTKQRKEAFLTFASENSLDPKSDEASYLYLVHEIKNRPDLLPGGAKTLDKLRETTNAEEAARSFMDNFERPGVPHFDTRLKYTNEIAGIPYLEDSLNETERIQNAFDLTSEQIAEATAEPITANAAISYDELRSEYPDIIDEDSSIWDRIDPALKAMKSEIVDIEGRQVGREALIAADAASRVLRNNGLSPRIVSGGREPSEDASTNHGQYSDANRSIDIQAYDADGNNVYLGKVNPQIREDMITAAQLSVEGENVRLGIPTDTNTGMHVQAGGYEKDNETLLPSVMWFYKGNENNDTSRFSNLFDSNKKLKDEERKKRLEALIGPTIGEEEPVATASTTESVTQPMANASASQLVNPVPRPAEPETATATPEPKKQTLQDITGLPTKGYSAAAGGAEITDPSMIISEDGKKVTRVAETGPEKLSVMPRHKSSDVFQEQHVMMQEARQEKAQEAVAKPDIATLKSSPRMSDFGRSRETGQSIAISASMPKITPSANKAFADAKMVGRFNKADIDGDMGIVYIDRGYA